MWVVGAVADRMRLKPLIFCGRVIGLPRVNAALLSLNMRWVPEGRTNGELRRERINDSEDLKT